MFPSSFSIKYVRNSFVSTYKRVSRVSPFITMCPITILLLAPTIFLPDYSTGPQISGFIPLLALLLQICSTLIVRVILLKPEFTYALLITKLFPKLVISVWAQAKFSEWPTSLYIIRNPSSPYQLSLLSWSLVRLCLLYCHQLVLYTIPEYVKCTLILDPLHSLTSVWNTLPADRHMTNALTSFPQMLAF